MAYVLLEHSFIQYLFSTSYVLRTHLSKGNKINQNVLLQQACILVEEAPYKLNIV